MVVLDMPSRNCVDPFWNLNEKSEDLGNTLLLSTEKSISGRNLFERNQNM